MAITYFANQSNPQQNPVYQAQQQLVTYQNPAGGDQDAGETFLQRQQRKAGKARLDQTNQTQNPGPAQNLAAPAPSSTSVTSNGRLSTAPAPVAQPMQPQGAAPSSGNRAQDLQTMQATATQQNEAWRAANPGLINYDRSQLEHAQSAAAPQPNVAPGMTPMPAPAPPTAVTPANEAQYGVPQDEAARQQFYAKLAPGMPVQGQPGSVWGHSGSGWTVGPSGQPQSGAPGAAQTPAPQFPGLPQLPANATYYADDLGNNAFSTYQGTQFNQAGLPTYQAGSVNMPNLPGYQPGQISQFTGPNQQAIQGSTEALIQQILNNPLSMSDQNVGALKEQQKELALAQQRQMQQQAAQSAASRGLAPGSGFLATQDRRAGDATQASLIGSYRDIDLAKMVQDQQERTAAAQLGDSYLSSQMGRATQGYQATLAGQQAREQTQQSAADDARMRAALGLEAQRTNLDEGFRGYQSQAAARQFGFDQERAQSDENFRGFQSTQDAEQHALQRAISQAGLNQSAADSGLKGFQSMLDAYNQQQGRTIDNRQLDIQQQLGQGGLDLDGRKLSETARQFDKGYNLDFLRYLLDKDQLGQQGSQFNQSLGLDWFKANSANTNNWLGLLP